MLTFDKYSIDNLKKYGDKIDLSPYNVNDVSKGSFFMWHKGVNLAFCETEGSFISMQDICSEPSFSYPFGGDEEAALKNLIEYVKENDLPLKFYGVTEEILEKIKVSPLFPKISYGYERKWSDYVYSAAEIAEFKGKKFSGQRNHINKFKSLYGEPQFKPLEKSDIAAVKEMLTLYAKEHPSPCYEENEEYLHTIELLENFFELNLIGGMIILNGKPVSVTIGEVQRGENLIIHVEKALKSVLGVYPTTFNAFVKYALTLYPNLQTANREDDSGDMGLRTSKLQYNPVKLVDKYLVKINSPLYSLTETPTIEADGIVLSEIKEADKQAYRNLCTDKENNRLWGYDYETDSSITGEINDDTFYDIVKFDRLIGEGISFAIREKTVDNRLIGEVIIYNFTYNGSAEIGVRVEKASQGKGIGTKAFKAGANFAEKVLKVKIKAKCYKENVKSKETILSCGFKQISEDEEFYYFAR